MFVMKIKDLRKIAKVKNVSLIVVGVLLMCGVVFLIGYGIGECKDALTKHFGVADREQLTDQYTLVTFNNRDVKIKSKNSAQKVPGRFDCCSMENMSEDSVLFLRKDCKSYTFSLKSGALSKPYYYLGDVGLGRAWVACIDENDKLGFVDIHTGKEVLPCQFGTGACCYDALPFFDGDYCIFPFYNDYYGIIDTTGKVLVSGKYIYETEFFEGYLVIDENDRESLYSKDMRCVLADKHDISIYRIGIVYRDSVGTTPMLTDFGFTHVTPVYPLFAMDECESILEINPVKNTSTELFYTFETSFPETGTGMIDQDMNLVIDPKWKWDDVVSLGNGYFVCYSDHTGFLVDKYGNFVVPKIRKTSLAKR